MMMKMSYYFVVGIASLVAFCGWKLTARAAYESAEYKVIESEGEFEIREYPDLVLVTTTAQLAREGKDGSFMRLFRYISGANKSEQKVAMTTPVFMLPRSTETGGTMSFVIPKSVAAKGAPQPASEQVALQKRPAGRFAVVRFAGRLNDESRRDAEKRLRGWLSQRGITAAEVAESAGYDPPWTPGPLRRNEVLIRIQ